MKYAFIFASNVYMSQQPTVSYADRETQPIEFLRISSFKPRKKYDSHHTALVFDANISLEGGNSFAVKGNAYDDTIGYHTQLNDDRVNILKNDTTLLDVHQLPEEDWHTLQTHILNEIEVQQPEAVFIIRGDFWVNGHRIIIDNEKLFVDDDSYATGVTNDHGGVILMPYDEDDTSY